MAKPTETKKELEPPVIIDESNEQEVESKEKIQCLLYINQTIDKDESKQLYSFDIFSAQ